MGDQQLVANSLFAERYQIVRRIGKGGMGEVYLAHDSILNGEVVALKVLRKKITSSEKHTQRFLREVQLTRQVTSENIVRTFDVGVSNGVLFFTMEYVEGETLSEKIGDGPVSWFEAGDILLQLCSGLEAIHERKIVHRDLKPGNIILTKDGVVKIADFGVARPSVSELTTHDEVIGSSHYMAPEVWVGKDISFAADIYALGIVAYEMLTGCAPFDADSPAELMWKHLEEAPVPPIELNQDIPDWLNKLILVLLEKDHDKRPCVASEVKVFVRRSLNGTAVTSEIRMLSPESVPAPVMTEFEVTSPSDFALEAPLDHGSSLESQENEIRIPEGGSHELDGHLVRVRQGDVSEYPPEDFRPTLRVQQIGQAFLSTGVLGFLLLFPLSLGLEIVWKKSLLYSVNSLSSAVLILSAVALAFAAALPSYFLARSFQNAARAFHLWKWASSFLLFLMSVSGYSYLSSVGGSLLSLERESIRREVLTPLSAAAETAVQVALLSPNMPTFTEQESSTGKVLIRETTQDSSVLFTYGLSLLGYLFFLSFLFLLAFRSSVRSALSRAKATSIFVLFLAPTLLIFSYQVVQKIAVLSPSFSLKMGPLSVGLSGSSLFLAGCTWAAITAGMLFLFRFRSGRGQASETTSRAGES